MVSYGTNKNVKEFLNLNPYKTQPLYHERLMSLDRLHATVKEVLYQKTHLDWKYSVRVIDK